MPIETVKAHGTHTKIALEFSEFSNETNIIFFFVYFVFCSWNFAQVLREPQSMYGTADQ